MRLISFRCTVNTFNATIVFSVLLLGLICSASGMLTPPPQHPAAVPFHEFLQHETKRYSQFNEELIIRHFFRDRRDGVFLDIGCAFPTTNSTTYFLEAQLHWSGIGVDAVEKYRPLWKASRPRSKFFHYAVSDSSGETVTFYQAAHPTISSLSEKQVRKHTDIPPVPVDVETITLNDLLDREHVSTIDFLSMDIEGAEPLALAGFDIKRFKPQLVCIETHEGAENESFITKYFAENGYERIEEYVPHDFANWYFKPKRPSKASS